MTDLLIVLTLLGAAIVMFAINKPRLDAIDLFSRASLQEGADKEVCYRMAKVEAGKARRFMALARPLIAKTLMEDGSTNQQRALKPQKWIT
jgi:hypothetical protein